MKESRFTFTVDLSLIVVCLVVLAIWFGGVQDLCKELIVNVRGGAATEVEGKVKGRTR